MSRITVLRGIRQCLFPSCSHVSLQPVTRTLGTGLHRFRVARHLEKLRQPVINIPAFYLSVAALFRENGCNANLDPHLWVAEGGDSQSSPDGGVVRHVVTEPLGHRLVHLVRKTNVIGVHLDHMLPRRTGASQGPFDIAERLGDLIRERLWELPVIVPTALP